MAEPIYTHKVVNIDKVSVKRRKTLGEYEKTYEANAKYDGCFAFVHLYQGGASEVYSRTRERYISMDGQADYLTNVLADEVEFNGGLVLLAEAWTPYLDFATLSGKFRKGVQNYELQFVVFDCLTQDEYEAGWSDVPFSIRMGRLSGKLTAPAVSSSLVMARRADRWAPGTYDALHLCEKLVTHRDGYDGLILADPWGPWKAGRGTTGEKVRIKRTLSFDLRVTGIFEGVGEKTGRPVYTISVDYKGKTLMVGSGMPHNKDALPKKGDIVEINAMDYSSEGLLREPRYKGIRYDKRDADA